MTVHSHGPTVRLFQVTDRAEAMPLSRNAWLLFLFFCCSRAVWSRVQSRSQVAQLVTSQWVRLVMIVLTRKSMPYSFKCSNHASFSSHKHSKPYLLVLGTKPDCHGAVVVTCIQIHMYKHARVWQTSLLDMPGKFMYVNATVSHRAHCYFIIFEPAGGSKS